MTQAFRLANRQGSGPPAPHQLDNRLVDVWALATIVGSLCHKAWQVVIGKTSYSTPAEAALDCSGRIASSWLSWLSWFTQ